MDFHPRGPSTDDGGAWRYYFAEDYHQQYLSKPGARPYCSAQPTGVPVPREWLKENGAKLGEGYWKKFGPKPGCTIQGSNSIHFKNVTKIVINLSKSCEKKI